jgi:DNA invertase Pin-like site-specific DNA recombinase
VITAWSACHNSSPVDGKLCQLQAKNTLNSTVQIPRANSLNDLIKILSDFEERKIDFRSLSESIDTTTAFGRMTFHMVGAIAQFERDLTSERTKAGLKAARKRGHRGGQPPKLKPKQLAQFRKLLEDETTAMEEVAPLFNVSVSAIFRAFAR